MSGFTFRRRHSSEFGIFTVDQARTLLPPRREGKLVIPGRSGYYDAVGAVYNERIESILCSFVRPKEKSVAEVCREIAYWLSKPGRLSYDKEPDKYYIARISGAPPMAQHLGYGEFTLTWSYNPPFAHGETITQQIANGENVIDYQGTAETPCTIVLRNTSKTNIVNVSITAIKRSV